MEIIEEIMIYSPFGCDALKIETPKAADESLIYAAALMENAGALWMISAGNLGDLDLDSMNSQFDLTPLSLSDHISRGGSSFEEKLPLLKAHFSHCNFEQGEHGQTMMSANLQIRTLSPFLRDFYLSGLRQVATEYQSSLFKDDQEFKTLFARVAELSIIHQQQAEQFDRLGELAFVVASLFSTVRLGMLKKRLFPYLESASLDDELKLETETSAAATVLGPSN